MKLMKYNAKRFFTITLGLILVKQPLMAVPTLLLLYGLWERGLWPIKSGANLNDLRKALGIKKWKPVNESTTQGQLY